MPFARRSWIDIMALSQFTHEPLPTANLELIACLQDDFSICGDGGNSNIGL